MVETSWVKLFANFLVNFVSYSGATPRYNSSTGILTLSQRGGYALGDESVTIKGPGTLYTTHLDLNPEDDYVEVSRADTPADWKDVRLTGNYSACIRMAGLEGVFAQVVLRTIVSNEETVLPLGQYTVPQKMSCPPTRHVHQFVRR